MKSFRMVYLWEEGIMDFKQLFELTWVQSKQYLVPLLILSLVLMGISIITLGILGPVAAAGFYSSILRMVKEDREPKATDVFSEMGLFLPLLVFSAVALIVVSLGFLFFILPGILICIALVFYCLYMLPLMVDKRLGLMDALKESYAMSRRGPLSDHIVVLIIITGVQVIGSSFVLGTLITTPLAAVFLMNVYEHKLAHDPH